MRINVIPYQKRWKNEFLEIKKELSRTLKEISPIIEHIGSTSIPNLAAKDVIDVAIGVQSHEELEASVPLMLSNNFIYYKIYNEVMPNRRFFIALKNKKDYSQLPKTFNKEEDIPHKKVNELRKVNIHIWIHNSSEWIRHIALRDYIMKHDNYRQEYQELKLRLSTKEWDNMMHYNKEKNDFIQKTQKKAVEWYN